MTDLDTFQINLRHTLYGCCLDDAVDAALWNSFLNLDGTFKDVVHFGGNLIKLPADVMESLKKYHALRNPGLYDHVFDVAPMPQRVPGRYK